MEGSGDYQSLQQQISAQLIATTRSAGQLAAEDLDFLRASDKKAGKRVDRKNGQLLDLAQQLMARSAQGTQVPVPDVKKPSQIEDNWRGIADVIDNLLERADRCLDEYTGVITKLSKEKEQAIQDRTASGRRDGKNPRIHPLQKPQLLFRKVPKNDETTPFKPLLTAKPHAVVPLAEALQPFSDGDEKGGYPHPYKREIDEYKYPARVHEEIEPISPIDDPEGKMLTWVDTPEKVAVMLKELKEAKEIAVDLEHHDTHTYVGLVSLMQISTREKDWIVDTLKPWRETLQVLNQVFADPKIVKVLHGSTMDIIWLQRDLGIYVVGLFDTYHASHALEYPRHGLAFLLKKFEDFDAQKQYQMADWRTRPLSTEMMQYARSDTHYLLHIYDNMRNELVQHSTAKENLVDYVLEKSKEECLQTYQRFIYNFDYGFGGNGWLAMLWRNPAVFSNRQFAVFRAVHQLRDQIARQNDEGLFAVMRNDTIYAIAREMPEQMPDLLSIVHPVTQFLQPKMSELLGVVKAAKAKGDSGPSMDDILNSPEVAAYQERMGFGSFRRRFDKKLAKAATAQSTGPALAEIIKNEREKADEAPKVADGSMFWGSTLNKASDVGQILDLVLRVPVPDATPTSSTDDDVTSSLKSTTKDIPGTSKTKTEPPTSKEAAKPATFSIKELKRQSRKRKAEAVEEPEAPPPANDEANEDGDQEIMEASPRKKDKKKTKKIKEAEETKVDGDDGDGDDEQGELAQDTITLADASESKRSKKQKKAEKKAAAQAAKEAQMDETPFDYASAPNILEGAGKDNKGKKDRKKAFDPYSRALDTSKGLPRRATGTAGRSKTFKN